MVGLVVGSLIALEAVKMPPHGPTSPQASPSPGGEPPACRCLELPMAP